MGDLLTCSLTKSVPVDKLVTYLSQIANAVSFLHSNHVVHCDVRAANVTVVSTEKVS